MITAWTSADLSALPQLAGGRYEIIEGELCVSTALSWPHQYVSTRLLSRLDAWCQHTGLGVALMAPGLIFAPDNDVIPDLIWVSHTRLQGALDAAGHLTVAPELVIEVLSPGRANQRRDREDKYALYARQGVQEYWIVDPEAQTVDVERWQPQSAGAAYQLGRADTLQSPLLPGFRCVLADVFWPPKG